MENEKKYFFDDPKNVKRILHYFYGSCVILFALDFVIHRHVIHDWENLWGFYPLYGFIGCVILVLVASWMRSFLMRSEDYYENEGKAVIEKKGKTDIEKNGIETTGIETNSIDTKPRTDKKSSDEVGGPNVDA